MKRLRHESRISLYALLAGVPGTLVALILLWSGSYSSKVQWTLTFVIAAVWMGFAAATRRRVVYPLQTLSNLLGAMREGDFSIRARGARYDDSLGEVMREVNALGATLREQRLGALEAAALVRKVMDEIDVAVFAFDGEGRLRLVNRASEQLLNLPSERLLGRSAQELGLAGCLSGEPTQMLALSFPGKAGRWEIRRSSFREEGRAHQLVVISDLSRALREEERQAWQRLIRVIGHELNNSLAPIRSVAESMESMLKQKLAPDWKEDMSSGLAVIGSRAAALGRFMDSYARLARLPAPKKRPMDVAAWVHRVVGLETRLHVVERSGPDVRLDADPDQLEQLLINLVRNAVDAALETSGGVRVCWQKDGFFLDVVVEDDGPGLSNPANLFVPFFTTKSGGSGIGLVLSRQIAEAHGGTVTLENRANGHGCEARLRLPLP